MGTLIQNQSNDLKSKKDELELARQVLNAHPDPSLLSQIGGIFHLSNPSGEEKAHAEAQAAFNLKEQLYNQAVNELARLNVQKDQVSTKYKNLQNLFNINRTIQGV